MRQIEHLNCLINYILIKE